ncbi:Ditrans,polycis-undecaprenyl-diphosphate synthase ((2E,6E)-farnesyl-diphosphate specific) [Fundidesulfovibrio magnetotacticus]|uniref:Isoprenyl transferase n=1 Tax=Fundidesulfovibrio magnetotacticus TaxID=2730080 RepID=A0A6V8LUY4_9BACT|nr:polyprenyl diphosphate synthase [Fundidesulfovibrio magnetotacticus]GFK94770.1 Ditrans,polycis-undecaprenyl-diphosphate synthase ((2E,6E)-farnesyl-diphosphate specific) [Fundidesulfovibrio magnetotacticus]
MSDTPQALPRHLAVIMDGNGRWAKARGLSRSEGHRAGTETAKRLVTRCRELGIAHLTLYTFSKENWKRPQDEVRTLFDLLVRFLGNELASLVEQDIRFNVLGELEDFPFAVRQALSHVLKKTAHCRSMTLNLALNYSGRAEILRACRRLVEQGVKPADITEERFSAELFTAGQPDPDLVVRTSGELRISNYLLWQSAYAEYYFTDVYWPDFDADELDKALAAYAGRQRRFGLTGEQALQAGD